MGAVRLRPALAARALRRLRQMATDRRGVSALEFAMIVPALILLYVGAVEIGNALTIFRRTSQVASTAADLTAQVKTITKSDIKDIQAASASILTPYSTSPLKIVLSTYPVPARLTEPDTSVIVAEITYSFTPLVGLTTVFTPGSFDMTRTFYTRPRRSLKAEKTDNGC
jgi:Flp pilus assembly protein TadG